MNKNKSKKQAKNAKKQLKKSKSVPIHQKNRQSEEVRCIPFALMGNALKLVNFFGNSDNTENYDNDTHNNNNNKNESERNSLINEKKEEDNDFVFIDKNNKSKEALLKEIEELKNAYKELKDEKNYFQKQCETLEKSTKIDDNAFTADLQKENAILQKRLTELIAPTNNDKFLDEVEEMLNKYETALFDQERKNVCFY